MPAFAPQSHARNALAVPDFSSDVGRKKFGFSHEEMDDSNAYYEGQFKLYQRCGEGTLHSPDTGSKYIGQFQADQFHGKGDQTWSDNSHYSGQWKDGQKNGFGVYTGADGLTYDGQWEEGLRHGQGTQEYCNGDTYSGWWFHGLCSGTGTYVFADGSRYEGAWANGRYDGPGIYYSCDGRRERQWHSSGLLMRREVMPPGAPPEKLEGKALREGGPMRRRALFSGNAIMGQTRDDMHKPTQLPRPQPSKYLIRRETAGRDLSAPPLRPKTASLMIGDGDMLFPPITEELRPSTAGGDSVLTYQTASVPPTPLVDSTRRDELDSRQANAASS